jgi:hypothetical protein
MIGKQWMEHFEKQSTPDLKKVHSGLAMIFSDPLIKKVYGEEEGLNTIQYFIERIVKKRIEQNIKKRGNRDGT